MAVFSGILIAVHLPWRGNCQHFDVPPFFSIGYDTYGRWSSENPPCHDRSVIQPHSSKDAVT